MRISASRSGPFLSARSDTRSCRCFAVNSLRPDQVESHVELKLPKTPLLAADCVVFDRNNRVLLIRRKNPPFSGQLALPGGFVETGETVEQACVRELFEETGIKVRRPRLVGVYSDPERDPRAHICSVAFVARVGSPQTEAGSDAEAVEWIKGWRRSRLAFDHRRIIADAVGLLRSQGK